MEWRGPGRSSEIGKLFQALEFTLCARARHETLAEPAPDGSIFAGVVHPQDLRDGQRIAA
jgi:hypothetical protein